jgi:hypothetical protein
MILFWLNLKKVTGELRRLRNEELNGLYSLYFLVIKSRIIDERNMKHVWRRGVICVNFAVET